jgi:hypothetical protein
MGNPVTNWSDKMLTPAMNPTQARQINVQLPASVVYAKGTILGELSGTPGTYKAYSSTVIAAPSVAPTVVDASGSTPYAAGVYNVAYTYTNSVGESTPSPASAVTLTATHQFNVSAITLPAGVTGVNYYISPVPGNNGTLVKVAANHNDGTAANITALPVASAALAPTVSTLYANTDGSQNAQAILAVDCATDSSSNVTFGAQASGNEHGVVFTYVPAYISGTFKTADLVQSGAGSIDANAVTKLGRLVEGTISVGLIRIG